MVKKTIGLAIIILITLTGLCWGQAQSDKVYNSVLRLHIIANSDESNDQALKLKVRDAIVEYVSRELKDAASAEQARQMAIDNIPQMEDVADHVIKSQGYSYPVEIKVGLCDFPTRSYGDLVLPQGEYQAVRIILGEGKGQNWWCVLFPPLCLVSTSEQGIALDKPENAEIRWKFLELLKADQNTIFN